MFDQKSNTSSFSVGLCILQSFGAPLATLIFGVLLAQIFEKLLGITADDLIAGTLLGYLVFTVEGLVIGYTTQVLIPRAQQSGGGWVWVLPCSVLAWGILDQFSRNPKRVLAACCISDPAVDEGIGIVLITWPAVATCFYSVGVMLASQPAKTAVGVACRKAIASVRPKSW